ncbi:hypothetical protein H9L21_07610 [Aeromicrobium senzhongii]|uniref:Uncharacterized protein n=1 Tax=Aeromicrobium senzhongii TaxID=2663859 RepID=A0ABX6SZ83_9ACTN|nr:hypothetical protein [Aeromicrobium senzhongii]MTB87169.1 hypothetical protein [Aeromicrobium senzhongii]QNL95754.1 hypothetical protein H9L21_07610 [Aeromicrobium senzhongii]
MSEASDVSAIAAEPVVSHEKLMSLLRTELNANLDYEATLGFDHRKDVVEVAKDIAAFSASVWIASSSLESELARSSWFGSASVSGGSVGRLNIFP